jgi:hypothetical protein
VVVGGGMVGVGREWGGAVSVPVPSKNYGAPTYTHSYTHSHILYPLRTKTLSNDFKELKI